VSRFLVLIFVLILSKGFAAEPFVICYENENFPPFLLGTTQHKTVDAGILPDLIDLSAAQLGVEIEYQRLPWKRCLNSVERGEADALFAVIFTEPRDAWAAYPKTNGEPDSRYLYLSEYPVFVESSSTLQWDGELFNPVKPMVQSVPGYVAEQRLVEMGISPMLPLQPQEAMPMVAAGRIDGYVVERLIGQQILADLELTERITTLPTAFLAQPWYLAFSKTRYAADGATIEALWNEIERQRQQVGESLQRRYLNQTKR
jgi:polar amino acid transport system substrate-binding protein